MGPVKFEALCGPWLLSCVCDSDFLPAAGMTNFIEISEFRLAAHGITKFMKFHTFFQHEAFLAHHKSVSGRSPHHSLDALRNTRYIGELELNNLSILSLICGDHIR